MFARANLDSLPQESLTQRAELTVTSRFRIGKLEIPKKTSWITHYISLILLWFKKRYIIKVKGESDFLSLHVLFAQPFLEMLPLIFYSDLSNEEHRFYSYQVEWKNITNKNRRTSVVKAVILVENDGSVQ